MHLRSRHPWVAMAATFLLAQLAAVSAAAQTREPPSTLNPPQEAPRGSTIRRLNPREEESAEGLAAWRSLQAGQVRQSELDRSDPRAEDGTLYEDWTFRGVPGTRVTVSMSSGDFDTFLAWGRMLDGEFVALATDDDGGEGVASRLTVWVRDDQEYVVRANAFRSGTQGQGRFSLFVQEAAPARDAGTSRGTIRPGQTVQGTLDPGDPLLSRGTYHETWRFTGRPGQRVIVSLRSTDFDTLLFWARVVGAEALAMLSDDDGGSGSNSEFTVEVDESGEYAILVSSIGPGGFGAYTLSVDPAGS
jgi:hypothetical protein